ncbi:MAG: glycoside hydrolase 5 family protein [Actinomycetota bacterium]
MTPETREPFRLGINYWPARTAMRWWTMFDEGETAEDFARIAAGGFDSVRIFLLWEAFQPDPDRVDIEMLDRLVTVADAAERAGLAIVPTLFTGHMSGVDWIPTWALGGTERDERFRVIAGGRVVPDGLRNWYTDLEILHAQARLAGRAAAALAGHGALWAWDLGNESSNCVLPPDRDAARRWLGEMVGAVRSADAEAAVTIGIHMEDLEEDRHLGPAEVAESCDFLTMHGYPIYARWARSGTDEHLVAFLARVTRWLGGGAEVMFSEFGLPTAPAGIEATSPLAGEQDAALYTRRALDGLRGAGATGAMLWCYSDYDPSAFEHPPLDEAIHERSFGLWRADGTPKPTVEVVKSFAGASRLPPPDREPWIDIDPERYWQQPGVELPRLYERYFEWTSEGRSKDMAEPTGR